MIAADAAFAALRNDHGRLAHCVPFPTFQTLGCVPREGCGTHCATPVAESQRTVAHSVAHCVPPEYVQVGGHLAQCVPHPVSCVRARARLTHLDPLLTFGTHVPLGRGVWGETSPSRHKRVRRFATKPRFGLNAQTHRHCLDTGVCEIVLSRYAAVVPAPTPATSGFEPHTGSESVERPLCNREWESS